MVGRIDAKVDGRPVSLISENKTLVFDVSRIRTLIKTRRGLRAAFKLLRSLLAQTDMRIMVRIGRLGNFELFPNPSYMVNLTLPR